MPKLHRLSSNTITKLKEVRELMRDELWELTNYSYADMKPTFRKLAVELMIHSIDFFIAEDASQEKEEGK